MNEAGRQVHAVVRAHVQGRDREVPDPGLFLAQLMLPVFLPLLRSVNGDVERGQGCSGTSKTRVFSSNLAMDTLQCRKFSYF